MPWKKFLLHDRRCKWTCLRKQWVSVFLFTVFIFNGTLPFRMLTNNTYTYTILFMNLMMICKLHQWNKTYFNRQSNDLQSVVELCVAQPNRSQVTGRKAPWKRGCVLMSSCLLYRAFSHDVTAGILVFQNNKTAAMLVSQTSSVGVELFSYVNTFFCFHKFA